LEKGSALSEIINNWMMKKFLLIFLCLAHYISWAQITPRHILEKAYSIEKVKETLIPLKDYKPYPYSFKGL